MIELFTNWMLRLGLPELTAQMLGIVCAVLFVVFVALLANYLAKSVHLARNSSLDSQKQGQMG